MKKSASVKLTKQQLLQIGLVAEAFPDYPAVDFMCFLGNIDKEAIISPEKETSSVIISLNGKVIRRLNIPNQESIVIDTTMRAAND